jgi:hypothetical protein
MAAKGLLLGSHTGAQLVNRTDSRRISLKVREAVAIGIGTHVLTSTTGAALGDVRTLKSRASLMQAPILRRKPVVAMVSQRLHIANPPHPASLPRTVT